MRNVFAINGLRWALLGAGNGRFAPSFDVDVRSRHKTIVLEGTVKEFQWTNPHSWLDVAVPDGKGGFGGVGIGAEKPQRTPPRRLEAEGTLKPGDKVKVSLHPLRKNGDHGGNAGRQSPSLMAGSCLTLTLAALRGLTLD